MTDTPDYATDYRYWAALEAWAKIPMRAYDMLCITPEGVTFRDERMRAHAAWLTREYRVPAGDAIERAELEAHRQRTLWLTAIHEARLRIEAMQRVYQHDREIYGIGGAPVVEAAE
jgi:hypothetical protein